MFAFLPVNEYGLLPADLVVHLFPSKHFFDDGLSDYIAILVFSVVIAVVVPKGHFALCPCALNSIF